MGKTSFVSIMLWKAFIVRVSCGVQTKVKIFKSNFQFLRPFIMRLTEAWKESEFLAFCECIPSFGNIILVTADWAAVTMHRQWSAGNGPIMEQSLSMIKLWCDEKIHFPSHPSVIQITAIVARCSHEHYPMKLLVLVVDMNGRRRGHDHVCAVVNCIDIE